MTNKKPESYASLLMIDNEIIKKKPKPPNKNDNSNKSEANKSTRRSRSNSPKNKKMKPSAFEEEPDWDIPDRQFGDLYCKPCDAHMNSDQMWEAHIQGKRHLKNVKKGDSGNEPKYEYINEDPILLPKLEADTRPIVGLQHLVEIQRLEQRPTYQCFLCSANIPTADQLLDHIAGAKHRLAYIKEHDPTRYELIQNSNLKKGHIEPVLEECIASFESQSGRGKMIVKREKEDYKSPPRKYKNDYSNSRPSRPSDRDRGRMDREKDRPYDSFDGPPRNKRFDRDGIHGRPGDGNHSRPGDSNHGRPGDGNHGRPGDGNHGRPCDYDRYGHGNRGPDSPPRNNLGRGRHFDDDKYSNPRYPPYEDERYGRMPELDERPEASRPPYYEKYDGPRPLDLESFRPTDKYATSRPPVVEESYGRSLIEEEKMRHMRMKEDNFGDLREVLQKKKSLEPTPVTTATSALDSIFGNVPEAALQIIEAMSPTAFLQVAFFKLNRIKIETDLDMKLLDKVSSKCSSLQMEVKTKLLSKNLQEQFKETIAQGLGITPQVAQDFQQIMDMVGQVKAESSKPVAPPKVPTTQANYNTNYLDPMYNAASYGTAESNTTNRNYSHQQANTASAANSYYSTPQIPGLTLAADNPTPTSQATPFDPFAVLSRHTKELFGGVQNKPKAYQY